MTRTLTLPCLDGTLAPFTLSEPRHWAHPTAPFRTRVAYAAALHGYGLTVVLDHGQGVVSVYAHAAVLLVAVGDPVARGQELGRIGDSGSLRGPLLYFEIREGGKPSDPARWLRSR